MRAERSDRSDDIERLAREALAEGRFDDLDRALSSGRLTLAELIHDLRVHQVELEMQAEELRETNLRLERSLLRFRRLFEGLPHSAVVTDRLGQIFDVNRQAEELFGVTRGSGPRSTLARLGSDPRTVTSIRGAFVEADRSGRSLLREVAMNGAAGEPRRVDLSIERLEESVPGEGDRFIAILVDATDRAHEQQRLRLLEVAVRQLNDVVMITEAGLIDEPGPRIVFVNDAFERLTGYLAGDVLGRSPRFLQGPLTERAELDRIRSACESGVPVHSEIANYDRDRRVYWIELDIVPIFDTHGTCTHFVAVQRDVTERRRLEDRERQSQRLEALGQLTGGVAHDFNNLLSVILGYADELARDHTLDSEYRGMAQMVRLAAERGADLTRRLLAFGRKQVLQPELVQIDSLIEGLIESMLRRTIGENIGLSAVLSAEAVVDIDSAQFESALLNLIVNARDAIRSSGTVTITSEPVEIDEPMAVDLDVAEGRYVSVRVTDDGHGIAPEQQPLVFEPFFTTKPSGKGTGLGLPIVFGFARQSGGTARLVDSTPAGTTIEILLPCASEVEPVEADASRPMPGSVDRRQATVILLVEDDDMVRTLASSQLRSLGHQVIAASSAEEALVIADERDDIALLFTDVLLPGIDGKQLAERIVQRRPGIGVLFASGYTRDALTTDGRLAPGVTLLEKPYRRADLADALRALLSD